LNLEQLVIKTWLEADMTQTSSQCTMGASILPKDVYRPRHADDSSRAQNHKPTLRPSRFLSSLMAHTLSLFIALHPLRKTHTQRTKGKKRERRDMHVGSGICRESAALVKTQWQAGWRQRGGHPTPHTGVQCVWRAQSL